jgi:hypothetical protein
VTTAFDDVVSNYAARRTGLARLLELIRKRRRNRSAVGDRKIEPPEKTDLFLFGERSTEAEIIFMSMMWMGM